MSDSIKARKKFAVFLKKRHPELKDEELPLLLNNINRFVKVVQKIYTEPQYQSRIKEKKIDGKVIKYSVIDTDLEEFSKVKDKSETQIPLVDAIKRFNRVVKNRDHGR